MGTNLLPSDIRKNYEVHEWKHACAVLRGDFPNEFQDIIETLSGFRLRRSWILAGGGGLSLISQAIDGELSKRGWEQKGFETQFVVDGTAIDSPTHKIDCYKNRVALEIEWNNKDPFFDRDLNNFRLLFDLRAISVGVIITRCDELETVFKSLGKKIADKYGKSTTHMGKLLPRIQGGGGAGCPLLVFGISRRLYIED